MKTASMGRYMVDRRLATFRTVASLHSFTKAAEFLEMGQPAVSLQVRQLEEHFDARLFERTQNHVTLTDVGLVVYDMSERIFEHYAVLERRVFEMTGEVGATLNIGASMAAAESALPVLLGQFQNEHPELSVRLKFGNSASVVSMLEQNKIDLAIVEGNISRKKLRVEPCRDDELVVIMPPAHPLAKHNVLRLNQLMPYPLVCRERGSDAREAIADYMVEQRRADAWKVSMELESSETIKGVVEAGEGLAIMSRFAIAKETRLGSLVGVPLNPPLLRRFSFVRQRQKFRVPAMAALLDMARQHCCQQVSG